MTGRDAARPHNDGQQFVALGVVTAAMPVLLASIGANSALLGLIEGLADGAASFAKLASGLYSDRLRRRKPLAVVGYLVTACGMASLALVTQWWQVLIARCAEPHKVIMGQPPRRLPRAQHEPGGFPAPKAG
jgi:MFS family permease